MNASLLSDKTKNSKIGELLNNPIYANRLKSGVKDNEGLSCRKSHLNFNNGPPLL